MSGITEIGDVTKEILGALLEIGRTAHENRRRMDEPGRSMGTFIVEAQS